MVENEQKREPMVSYTRKYIYHSTIILGLINLIDIFTSNAGPLTASFVVKEFLISQGVPENMAYAQYGLAMALFPIFGLLALALRYIADKYGRKPALIINVVGMTAGALLVILSQTFWAFVISTYIGTLFLAADIQMLLINEECPKDKRGQFFAFVKIVGLIGALLVPFMRGVFISSSNPNWRALYYLPLIGGIIITVIVIFTLKESSVYLTMKAQQKPLSQKKENKESFLKVMKNVYKIKSFNIVLLVTIVTFLGSMAGQTERSYFEPFLMLNFTLEEVNLIFYLRYIISIGWGYIIGKITDNFGRKPGLLITLISLPIFLVLCLVCVQYNLAILAGLTYGIFIFSLWLNQDTGRLMINELSPTKYRGTVGIYVGLIYVLLYMAASIIFSILILWMSFEMLFLVSVIPGCLIAIPIVIKILPETKGTDLTTVLD